jgi:NitT/TauT family transport system substrate-binding protein
MRVRLTVLAAGLLFVLSACGTSPGASSSASGTASSAASGGASQSAPAASATPAPATMVIGLAQANFAKGPLYVAAAKGFWKDENLDVQMTTFDSSTAAEQALLGKAVIAVDGGITDPMVVTAQSEPAPVFAFVQGLLPYRLMAQPNITDVKQLAGKTLAISQVGALSDQLTRITLREEGVDPNSAKYQPAGGSSSRLAALQAKAVDAAILEAPNYQKAQKEGMNNLVTLKDVLKGYPYEIMYAPKATIDANRDIFVRFTRGLIRGAQYFSDPANEEEVLKIVGDAAGLKADQAKIAYDDTVKDFPPTSEISKEGIQLALDGMQKYGNAQGIDKVTIDSLYYPDLQQEALQSLGLK